MGSGSSSSSFEAPGLGWKGRVVVGPLGGIACFVAPRVSRLRAKKKHTPYPIHSREALLELIHHLVIAASICMARVAAIVHPRGVVVAELRGIVT